MPTYEYVCDACEHQFEEFQSITAKALRKCPACGKSKLRRLIGIGAGVIFKGSGFYETDYRSDGYKSATKADKPGNTKDGKPAATSTPDTAAQSASSTPSNPTPTQTAKPTSPVASAKT